VTGRRTGGAKDHSIPVRIIVFVRLMFVSRTVLANPKRDDPIVVVRWARPSVATDVATAL